MTIKELEQERDRLIEHMNKYSVMKNEKLFKRLALQLKAITIKHFNKMATDISCRAESIATLEKNRDKLIKSLHVYDFQKDIAAKIVKQLMKENRIHIVIQGEFGKLTIMQEVVRQLKKHPIYKTHKKK